MPVEQQSPPQSHMTVALKDLQSFRSTAEAIALEAGKMALSAAIKPKTIEAKTSFQDLVTETDKAVEHHIRARLHSAFPDHQYLLCICIFADN